MKITNVEVVEFRTTMHHETSRWSYGVYLGEAATSARSGPSIRVGAGDHRRA